MITVQGKTATERLNSVYYVVVGSCPGDNLTSSRIILAPSKDLAVKAFEQDLTGHISEEARGYYRGDTGTHLAVYIDAVFASDSTISEV